MLKALGVLVLCFAIAACGGGGSGDGGSGGGGGAASSLVGTYRLTAFTFIPDVGPIVTQNDAFSFSGTLVLNSNGTLSQTTELDGQVAGDSGTWSEANGSTFFATSTLGGCTGVLSYTLSNGVLSLTSDHQCGLQGVRTMVWVRTGGAPAKPSEHGAEPLRGPLSTITGQPR